MKYAVAALLGLVSVNAEETTAESAISELAGKVNNVFDGVPTYLYGQNGDSFTVQQTLNWVVEYGSYFAQPEFSVDIHGDYVT